MKTNEEIDKVTKNILLLKAEKKIIEQNIKRLQNFVQNRTTVIESCKLVFRANDCKVPVKITEIEIEDEVGLFYQMIQDYLQEMVDRRQKWIDELYDSLRKD